MLPNSSTNFISYLHPMQRSRSGQLHQEQNSKVLRPLSERTLSLLIRALIDVDRLREVSVGNVARSPQRCTDEFPALQGTLPEEATHSPEGPAVSPLHRNNNKTTPMPLSPGVMALENSMQLPPSIVDVGLENPEAPLLRTAGGNLVQGSFCKAVVPLVSGDVLKLYKKEGEEIIGFQPVPEPCTSSKKKVLFVSGEVVFGNGPSDTLPVETASTILQAANQENVFDTLTLNLDQIAIVKEPRLVAMEDREKALRTFFEGDSSPEEKLGVLKTLLRDMMQPLEQLHNSGYEHRDIKLAQYFIRDFANQGYVLALGDFGSCGSFSAGSSRGNGTLEFDATDELAGVQPGNGFRDHYKDQTALAASLIDLATGVSPNRLFAFYLNKLSSKNLKSTIERETIALNNVGEEHVRIIKEALRNPESITGVFQSTPQADVNVDDFLGFGLDDVCEGEEGAETAEASTDPVTLEVDDTKAASNSGNLLQRLYVKRKIEQGVQEDSENLREFRLDVFRYFESLIFNVEEKSYFRSAEEILKALELDHISYQDDKLREILFSS